MTDHESRQLRLLEEMRDLLKEDVRLRQAALDEQRGYQARAQQSIAAAAKQQRTWFLALFAILVLWLGSSFLLPLLFSLVGAGLQGGRWGLDAPGVPSRVDTSSFDGQYALLEDRSFAKMREEVQAADDVARRLQGEKILRLQTDRFRPFQIRHGVIRAGSRLTQEFSLLTASTSGTTLSGRALWHEDVHDPGDASEESIMLRLEGDVLEFAMLDDEGIPLDPVFLKRVSAR